LPEERRSLESWLIHKGTEVVRIRVSRAGKEKDLIDMASENALLAFKNRKEPRLDEILNDLAERLKLGEKPDDIGAFDVSTISGNESVGAFVYWSEGEFDKNMYRRLKIKTIQGIDDYSMMKEIIDRTIANLKGNLPDLVVIDGGKGQLEIAKKVFDKNVAALKKPPILIAIAKKPDRAYLTTSDAPVDLEDRRLSSLLLKKIRDEAHRFAISYHRRLREKGLLQSPLEMIPGIGKKRRLELLRVFGSIEDIRNAAIDEIASLKGFNKKIAKNLVDGLRRIE